MYCAPTVNIQSIFTLCKDCLLCSAASDCQMERFTDSCAVADKRTTMFTIYILSVLVLVSFANSTLAVFAVDVFYAFVSGG